MVVAQVAPGHDRRATLGTALVVLAVVVFDAFVTELVQAIFHVERPHKHIRAHLA